MDVQFWPLHFLVRWIAHNIRRALGAATRQARQIAPLQFLSSLVLTLLISMPTGGVAAGPPSPFIGHWQAIDVDGSDIRLAIAGPPEGPFQITWTESYISFCDGEAGIVRGTGFLNAEDPNLLEGDLVVECLISGQSLEFHQTFRYHANADTLSTSYDGATMTVFTHPGNPHDTPEPITLKVNYQDNWVEGFYEGGHTVWLTVTGSDGMDLKATAEVLTEDGYFGTEPQPGVWSPEPPEIEPQDWVYAWVDNGTTAQMRVGELSTSVDLLNDKVAGVISADWFGEEEIHIFCSIWDHDEGASATVVPDGASEFTCSFEGIVDIVAGDVAEIVYYGPDGHGVNYYLYIPNPHVTVNPNDRWFEGYDWPDGATVDVAVTDNPKCTTSEVSWGGFFNVGFPDECNVGVGDEITLSDGSTTRTHVMQQLAVESVNETTDIVAASADFDTSLYTLHAWIHGVDDSYMDMSMVDGTWQADFSAFDLQPGMCGRVEINDTEYGNGTAADWCVPNTRFTVFPEWNYLEGYEWPEGAVVSITVTDKGACSASATAGHPEWDPRNTFFSVDLPGDCSLEDDDVVTLSTDGLSRTHEVQMLAVTQVDMRADTVSGTADFDPEQYTLHTWIHEVDDSYMELTLTGGTWEADFSGVGLTLEFGMGGRVEVVDGGSNATAVDWNTPPAMGLRVNYGHDWVESFYEAGHEVSIRVTDQYGVEKASSTVVTGPRSEWGNEPGFQLQWDPTEVDLQPYDWVYAEVDNGVTARLQLGEILGEVFVFEDQVSGTVIAPGIEDPVQVECLDWGSGGDAGNQDGGWINPDGSDSYNCMWDSGVWDIQPWQDIGVGYFTPEGHWVANAFHAEHWVGMYVYDLSGGTWSQGNHTYHFEHSYSEPFGGGGASEPIAMVISSTLPDGSDTPEYGGYVLLQYWAQRAWTGDTCEPIDVIHPDQPTRFVWGWMTDSSMSWEEALAHFDSFSVTAYWEDGATDGSQDLERVSLVRSDEFEGACVLTAAP
jgi:hypothetical protein